jgi:hypothetical protein
MTHQRVNTKRAIAIPGEFYCKDAITNKWPQRCKLPTLAHVHSFYGNISMNRACREPNTTALWWQVDAQSLTTRHSLWNHYRQTSDNKARRCEALFTIIMLIVTFEIYVEGYLRIFPLAPVSRPALGHTKPPVQWVPGVLYPGVKLRRGVMLITYLLRKSCT